MKTSVKMGMSICAMALLFVAGCAHCPVCGQAWPSDDDSQVHVSFEQECTVSGGISCLERVTLLPTYQVRIQLIKKGAHFGQAEVIQEKIIDVTQKFPMPFSLTYTYNPDAPDLYGLEAQLLSSGTPIFSTDTQYCISTHDGARIDLVLMRIQK